MLIINKILCYNFFKDWRKYDMSEKELNKYIKNLIGKRYELLKKKKTKVSEEEFLDISYKISILKCKEKEEIVNAYEKKLYKKYKNRTFN